MNLTGGTSKIFTTWQLGPSKCHIRYRTFWRSPLTGIDYTFQWEPPKCLIPDNRDLRKVLFLTSGNSKMSNTWQQGPPKCHIPDCGDLQNVIYLTAGTSKMSYTWLRGPPKCPTRQTYRIQTDRSPALPCQFLK